jgi:holo-[acyl-carrier protein] synthase
MILGLGTDIVDVERIAKMIADHGDHFLERTFTAAEIQHCQPRREAAQHFAGFTKDVGWTDIEILVRPSGQPYVTLHGSTRKYATSLGIGELLITISHTRSMATATAIALPETA